MPSAYSPLIAISIALGIFAAFNMTHSESHSQGHEHGHAHGHDSAAQANAEHFNKVVDRYESVPHLVELSNLYAPYYTRAHSLF